MAEKIIDALTHNPALQEKRRTMLENMEPYTVGLGDTVASIAHKCGIEDYHDLVILNRLMGNDLKVRGKNGSNILIHVWDTVYVPKNIERFRAEVESVKKLSEALAKNEMVAKGDREGLKQEMHERIFPSTPESVGTARSLQGFIKAQEASIDPSLPRIVDVAHQDRVSCANLVRTLLAQGLNVRDMKTAERKFFRKQNVDAWMLPGELKKIGYTQALSLMGHFASGQVGSRDPIDSDKHKEYSAGVMNIGEYLEEKGVPGSLVPIYFRGSDYKDDVAAYNRGRKDKHYNTHQSIYAGMSTMKFQAQDFWGAKPGKVDASEKDPRTAKTMTAADCLLNFLQRRGDIASSVTPEGRERFLRGMKKYHSLIHMKINGKEVDMAEELNKWKKTSTKVTPDDKIEITGPMMIDGLHMANSDPDRKKNMNARTRFYFEFAVSDMFLPTEVLEPWKDSTFRKEAFGRPTDDLLVKGTYDLRRGVILEKAIKKQIPIFEKEAFANLDPASEEYRALRQKYYGLQIKALQMMGVIEDENRLNPGGTNINRTISYFDTANIPKIYTDCIQTVKTQKLADNKETAPYVEYLDIQMLPGDTYANLFARIVKNLENHQSHFEKFPSIRHIGGFNDYLKKEFLKRYVEWSIRPDQELSQEDRLAGKVQEPISWEDLLAGKVKSGAKFLLHLAQADKIAGELRDVSYTPSIDNILKKVDGDVLDMVVPTAQNKHIIESTMYVESYGHGPSRIAKKMFEEYPELHKINSYGDFQLRGIQSLRNGFGKEWITKDQLESALGLLDKPEVKAYVEAFSKAHPDISEVIARDSEIVREIQTILRKDPQTPEDCEKMTALLLKLVRLDDDTSSNIIGKCIGASFINDKINSHFQKLNGVLEMTGDPIKGFAHNPEKMGRHEDAVYVINNMGEKQAMLGFAENYLYRIAEQIQGKDRVQYAVLKRKKYPVVPDWLWLEGRGLDYKTSDFAEHVGGIKDQLSRLGNNQEPLLTNCIHTFWEKIQKIHQGFLERRQDLTARMDASQNEREKEQLKKERDGTYFHEDGQILGKVYALVSDPVLRGRLAELGVDTSILPTETEISAKDSFRSDFFNHVRKGNNIEREAAGKRKNEVNISV